MTTTKLNQSTIKKYLSEITPSGLSLGILQNWRKSDDELVKKLNTTLSNIQRFRKLNVLWINQWLAGERKGGKKYVPRELGSRKKKIVPSFVSDGKGLVKEVLLKKIIDKRSPREGTIATLPFLWDFEKQIVKIPSLKGLKFQGYEFAVTADKARASRKTFKQSTKILNEDKELSKRCILFNHNINDVLNKETTERYAHIFADYCGAYSTNADTIAHILNSKVLLKNGLLWVTVSSHDKHSNGGTKDLLPELVRKANKSMYRYMIEKIDGKKVFQYQGSKSGSGAPMYTMIIRRVK